MGLNEIAGTIATAIRYCDIQWSLLVGTASANPLIVSLLSLRRDECSSLVCYNGFDKVSFGYNMGDGVSTSFSHQSNTLDPSHPDGSLRKFKLVPEWSTVADLTM